MTPAVANLVCGAKTFRIDSAIQTGKKFGMQLLDDHLWDLYNQGVISAEVAVDKAKTPGALVEKIHDSGGQIGRTELDEKEEGKA